MPLAKITSINQNVAWGLWNISESENELLSLAKKLPIDLSELTEISHPTKRLEWLAGKCCLAQLLDSINESFGGLYKSTHGKPFLTEQNGHISLSHSFPYAAAIFNKINPAGIDIEPPHEKLRKISQRFMNEQEHHWAANDLEKMCVFWTAKETLYKIMDIHGVSFQDDMLVSPLLDDFSKLSGIFKVDGQTHNIPLVSYKYEGFIISCNY
jgi:4'-phosphopantetheinyl transferase